MQRVQLNHITFDIGFDNGLYFAHATSCPSSTGKSIEELSSSLAELTGIKKEDLSAHISDILS